MPLTHAGLRGPRSERIGPNVEHEPREIAVRQIGEERVPKRIVLLKQDQHGEIGHVAEHTGHGESGVGCTPQRGRRAIVVEALERHGAMRLQLVDLVHDGL